MTTTHNGIITEGIEDFENPYNQRSPQTETETVTHTVMYILTYSVILQVEIIGIKNNYFCLFFYLLCLEQYLPSKGFRRKLFPQFVEKDVDFLPLSFSWLLIQSRPLLVLIWREGGERQR